MTGWAYLFCVIFVIVCCFAVSYCVATLLPVYSLGEWHVSRRLATILQCFWYVLQCTAGPSGTMTSCLSRTVLQFVSRANLFFECHTTTALALWQMQPHYLDGALFACCSTLCGRYATFETLGSASRTSSLTH